MIPIAVIDDNGGVAFNHRRQSKDRLLRERILSLCGGKKLWVTPYTAAQFDGEAGIDIAENPFLCAKEGDFVWAEDLPLENLPGIEKVIIYRWNRTYPFDRTFDFPLAEYILTASSEFEGHSHPQITEEIYLRKR